MVHRERLQGVLMIPKEAIESSRVGIDYIAKKTVSKFVSEYLVYSGFEVYPSDGEIIISWKKREVNHE